MAMNKFQRSVFSETTRPIELKFHMKTSQIWYKLFWSDDQDDHHDNI